jgi:YesN/AraC family two-component response regulator
MNIVLIKNMVCPRCILTVEDILNKSAIPFHKVYYGEIHLPSELSGEQKKNLTARLKKVGFELIDSQMIGLIEKIKILIIKRARNEVDDSEMKLNISAFLSEKLHYEYTYLSSSFSAVEGRTIESFLIEQRIKRAKELLDCGQMTLSEIAYELEYSSTAYFSTQFKKITGITPSYFKESVIARRKALDKA